MRDRRSIVPPTESKAIKDHIYRKMETSDVDKTNFYRKPYYMTCNYPKRKEIS